MMLVSTTGYIVACIGPFFSDFSNNDASIMKDILLQNTEDILNWIEEVGFVFLILTYDIHHSLSSAMFLWLTEVSETLSV